MELRNFTLTLFGEEEAPAENHAMTVRFRAEIDRLAGRRLDAAFLVLDPRQGTDFARGFDYFMRCTDTVRAYPMHFWKRIGIFFVYPLFFLLLRFWLHMGAENLFCPSAGGSGKGR